MSAEGFGHHIQEPWVSGHIAWCSLPHPHELIVLKLGALLGVYTPFLPKEREQVHNQLPAAQQTPWQAWLLLFPLVEEAV